MAHAIRPHGRVAGREIVPGDCIEFLGRAHLVTRIEPHNLEPRARVVFADGDNWRITIFDNDFWTQCRAHSWLTMGACRPCARERGEFVA